MIPLDKVKNIIQKYETLEKELSLEANDKKLFVKKSKEYASLKEVINEAKFYVNFENEKKSLENIINDKKSEEEMINLAKSEMSALERKYENYQNKIKIFLLPKDEADLKNPNSHDMINKKLKIKQEEYKTTVYVKDLKKTLVEKWGLSDDSNNIILFGKDGKVLYSVDGEFTESQVQELINVIKLSL